MRFRIGGFGCLKFLTRPKASLGTVHVVLLASDHLREQSHQPTIATCSRTTATSNSSSPFLCDCLPNDNRIFYMNSGIEGGDSTTESSVSFLFHQCLDSLRLPSKPEAPAHNAFVDQPPDLDNSTPTSGYATNITSARVEGGVLIPMVPHGPKTSSPTLRPYDAPDIPSWDDASSTQLHHRSGVG